MHIFYLHMIWYDMCYHIGYHIAWDIILHGISYCMGYMQISHIYIYIHIAYLGGKQGSHVLISFGTQTWLAGISTMKYESSIVFPSRPACLITRGCVCAYIYIYMYIYIYVYIYIYIYIYILFWDIIFGYNMGCRTRFTRYCQNLVSPWGPPKSTAS